MRRRDRRKKRLEDEALVVRGGHMELIPLRIAVDACMARHSFYGLSFFGDNGLSLERIVSLAGLEHTHVRVTTMGRLRAMGHEPARWGAYPHLSLRFEVSPTDGELVDLAGTFDEAIPSPGRPR
jgi:hypothetical protein